MQTNETTQVTCQFEENLQARHALRRWEQKSRQMQADREQMRRLSFQAEPCNPEKIGIFDELSVDDLIAALEDAAEREAVAGNSRFLDWD